jgi:predicted mannosyl-3-phosphoglycerate phosphatase (HAD superfamily)
MGKIIYSLVLVKKDSEKFIKLLSSLKGILGVDLSVVFFGEIMAVVSDIKKKSTLSDKSNVVEYAKVIEILAQQFTVLPVQYGSIMESTEVVQNMLKKNYSKFHENLEKVENKVEFGLKVFCDSKKIKKELVTKLELDLVPKSIQKHKTSIYKEYIKN